MSRLAATRAKMIVAGTSNRRAEKSWFVKVGLLRTEGLRGVCLVRPQDIEEL